MERLDETGVVGDHASDAEWVIASDVLSVAGSEFLWLESFSS